MRSKWLLELRSIVVQASLPVVAVAASMKDPNMCLTALGWGRRARTLRRRVFVWRRVSRYLQLTCGRSWPRSPADVLDYIATLVDANAPKSVDRALHALRFIEIAGGGGTQMRSFRVTLFWTQLCGNCS